MEKQQRSDYLDILKGVTILLVVIGHCIQFGNGENYINDAKFWENPLYMLIYSFHMPLFALLSGYLFAFSIKKHPTKDVITSKIKSCIVPIVTVQTILLAVRIITEKSIPNAWSIIVGYLTTYWFLWGIFINSMFVVIVHKYFNDNIWAYICGFMLTFVFTDELYMHLYKFIYPFFVCGYLFSRFNIKLTKKTILIYGVLSFVLYCILMMFWNTNCYIYTSKYCVIKDGWKLQLLTDNFRMIVGFLGCIWVMSLVFLLQSRIKNKGIITHIGKNSIGIYIFSIYLNQFVMRPITYNFAGINYITVLIESVIMTAVCLLLTYVCNKVKVLRILFLGGRG